MKLVLLGMVTVIAQSLVLTTLVGGPVFYYIVFAMQP